MLFQKKDKRTKFWSWFIKNKKRLETFMDSDRSDFTVFNQLTVQTKKVHPEIIPEMGFEGDNYMLILSCDGIVEGIRPVQELAETAPKIEGWVIKKFRQPFDNAQLNFDGLELKSDDIGIIHELDNSREKVDITIFIKGYDSSDIRYQQLGYLYLDHIIGEFNAMTRVGYIDFDEWTEGQDDYSTLKELRLLIEDNLYLPYDGLSYEPTERWPASVSQAKILTPENSLFEHKLPIGTEYFKIAHQLLPGILLLRVGQ